MLKDSLLTFCSMCMQGMQSVRLAGIDEGQKTSEQEHGKYRGYDM